jgi:hypothetical protein
VRGFAIRVAPKAINGLAAKGPDFNLQRINGLAALCKTQGFWLKSPSGALTAP